MRVPAIIDAKTAKKPLKAHTKVRCLESNKMAILAPTRLVVHKTPAVVAMRSRPAPRLLVWGNESFSSPKNLAKTDNDPHGLYNKRMQAERGEPDNGGGGGGGGGRRFGGDGGGGGDGGSGDDDEYVEHDGDDDADDGDAFGTIASGLLSCVLTFVIVFLLEARGEIPNVPFSGALYAHHPTFALAAHRHVAASNATTSA